MSVEARRAGRMATALTTLGIEPLEVVPIADAAAWSRSPRSFRVTTRRHGVVKVRLMRGPYRAVRATVLATQLGDPRVPVPLGCVGSTTVERWIDGVVLASTPLRAVHVDAAADLLAAIHGFEGVHEREGLPRQRRVAPVAARAARQLRELAAAKRLTSGESRRLLRIVTAGLPVTSAWGLTHNDFCAANLVIDRGGTLVSIDNELFVRGFLEYDVARVWYRWPMPDWAERRFARRYRSAHEPVPAAGEQHAWRVVATLKGAHLRHRIGAPNADALAALRRLLQ